MVCTLLSVPGLYICTCVCVPYGIFYDLTRVHVQVPRVPCPGIVAGAGGKKVASPRRERYYCNLKTAPVHPLNSNENSKRKRVRDPGSGNFTNDL